MVINTTVINSTVIVVLALITTTDVTMPRISYKKQLLQWYFRTLESLFDDVVCEENLEMIDFVEEEEEIKIQVLLGAYLVVI